MCDSDLFRKMNISSTYFTRVVIIQCFFSWSLGREGVQTNFLVFQKLCIAVGRIPHWYHSKCRLMSGNLFKHFLSIQKLSRHHAESVSGSVQIASSIYPSYLNLSERESGLNRCMKPMVYILGSRVGLVAFFFNSPSQGKRFIYSNFVEVWSIHVNRSLDR